ncbi:unnamed protein product [Linum tenue]|uniref:Bifunctional inhibitor/plant lipid transfer protein/seed storage helical domain-containing protein n=1 Tax=Linum tenue TaxID=586396 RepID=A0AAV0RPC7_9ROSI|nr:unnamed protein product [Linum tenue]
MTNGFARIFATALLLLLAANANAAAAVAPSTPSPEDCVTDMVAFSPCFGYVSAPPNGVRRHRLSAKCCSVVLESFSTGGSKCYCQLVKQPLLFGFPLNRTRIASLPALCSRRHANDSSTAVAKLDSSLESICAGSFSWKPFLNRVLDRRCGSEF